MDDMQSKLNSILDDPQMMQKIMAMAQAMGQDSPPPPSAEEAPISMPDAAMIRQVMGFAQQTGVDSHQKALLQALSPYLNSQRIHKLERAMRAAKVASVASAALGSGGLSFLTGR